MSAALGALIVPWGAALAQDGSGAKSRDALAVVFPDIGEPFRKVFTDIIGGVEEHTRQKVPAYPVAGGADPAELAGIVKRNGHRAVIALGRQGFKAAAALEVPVVVGGIASAPDDERLTGICLTPDPALLFAHLKALDAGVRRVTVIYNPQHNEWLVKLAREAARAAALELNALEAHDLASAARLYHNVFAGAVGGRDALWLPLDPTTVDDATILPIVLREAWNRNVAVFSSSLAHVKRGALFALYPNNAELGRNLAVLATAVLSGAPAPRGVTPLREVLAGLNLRTAGHLGLSLPTRVQRAFHSFYPEP
jgi:putative ABC transport system substrate-binding protein